MRTAVLIAAAAAALTLSACNRADDAAPTDGAMEADAASGAAADTAATASGGSGGGNAAAAGSASGSGSGSGYASGETMDPAARGTVTDGAMTPSAQPTGTAGNNVTETERRLNPPAPQ